ncbi:testosterone 17-beta-dehydrogenase [Raphidocelis subcapitata]|uniref:Testosterone 17-beta-dehydrogenase n=1 Tax=Raphidocelis subcapitata TaxID=307507 RepID=A0A2V0P2E8_9CHLO|nr:testosterone 17-beta-dehydrogenase [Raphidocelis subcapitata]|eukprot:GBF94051.1 testosterone 17-beta-dehydrogenase [Raphidocelis subcapitata]
MSLWGLLLKPLGWAGLLVGFASFGLYALLQTVCGVWFRTQNLKKRYNAQWALVTGSSSGIGKSIAKKLATQGLNVVLVALQDDLLDSTFEELSAAFPAVEFRKVGANLGQPGYMAAIASATADIDVQIVFANAGYILSGFFYTRTAEQIRANIECNALSAVHITHHFLKRMMDSNLKGCFVYTSSASAVLPSPFAVSYASTKAFLSMFAISLAPEVKWLGIDVLAVHPSPVASRFYDASAKIGMMEAFKKLAVGPDDLPDIIFASVGRTIWKDVGGVAWGFRLLEKTIDLNVLFTLAAPIMHLMPDFQQQLRAEQERARTAS